MITSGMGNQQIPEPEGALIDYHNETGMVSFIGTEPGERISVPGAVGHGIQEQDRGRAILDFYAPMFGEDNPRVNMALERVDNIHRGGTGPG